MPRCSFGKIAALALALTFIPATAQAFDEVFEVGFGIVGVVGGNFIDKPGDQNITLVGIDRESTADHNDSFEYPGFAGVTTGIGFLIELRFIEYIGVEFNAYQSTDRGSADVTSMFGYSVKGTPVDEREEFSVDILQRAWHLPLLFKAILPGEIAQPWLFVGPEFVLPTSTEAVDDREKEENKLDLIYKAIGRNYMYITFGLGIEFKLPLPVVDIRLPLNVRISVNPSISESRMDRAYYAGTLEDLHQITYVTEFKYQAVGTLGATMFF